MDNYKIKVKDEAESKEAQELFFALGAKRADGTTNVWSSPTVYGLLIWDGLLNYVFADSVFDDSNAKELTLPQLRDLVVLKRNDVKDANKTNSDNGLYFLSSDNVIYRWEEKWVRSILNDSEDYNLVIKHGLTPIKKHLETATGRFDENGEHHLTFSNGTEEKDPALISGADVPALIKKGESVQFRSVFNVQGGGVWKDLNLERDEEEFSLGDLINTRFEWRLKPQTIKLELELPKPFEPRDGDECFIVDSEQEDGFYRFTYSEDSGFHQNFIQFGAYRTEEDVKKAVEQLRKIRGTNS